MFLRSLSHATNSRSKWFLFSKLLIFRPWGPSDRMHRHLRRTSATPRPWPSFWRATLRPEGLVRLGAIRESVPFPCPIATRRDALLFAPGLPTFSMSKCLVPSPFTKPTLLDPPERRAGTLARRQGARGRGGAALFCSETRRAVSKLS
jgi:hypothetical protein